MMDEVILRIKIEAKKAIYACLPWRCWQPVKAIMGEYAGHQMGDNWDNSWRNEISDMWSFIP